MRKSDRSFDFLKEEHLGLRVLDWCTETQTQNNYLVIEECFLLTNLMRESRKLSKIVEIEQKPKFIRRAKFKDSENLTGALWDECINVY
jgi:hypothetical protein